MDEHRDTAPLLWTVPVRDPFNRQRDFVIDVRDGHVVLLPPPGEGCTLSPDQVMTLIAALYAANDVAEQDTTAADTQTGTAHDSRGPGGSTPTPRPAGSTTTPPPPAAVTPAAGSVEMRHSA